MYNISISNPKELLLNYGSEVCSNFTYIKMYDNICNWLSNNNSTDVMNTYDGEYIDVYVVKPKNSILILSRPNA